MVEGQAADPGPAVSVVVTCTADTDVTPTLAMLAGQSLSPDLFEVLLVRHGSGIGPSGPAALGGDTSSLSLRVLDAPGASAWRARNLGAAAAVGRWLTFLTPGQGVEENHLAALLELAGPGVVPLAERDAGEAFPWAIDEGSLLPTDVVRAVPFDERLVRGADAVFALDLATRFRFRPVRAAARLRRDAAAAAPGGGAYDVEVDQALEVLARLDPTTSTGTPGAGEAVLATIVQAESARIAAHVAAYPQDRRRALDAIIGRGLAERFDWSLLNGPADLLAVLYCFLPYADTSALVASRRLRARGEVVDVVSNDLDAIRGRAEANWRLVEDVLSRHVRLGAPASTGNWRELAAFIEEGLAVVEGWIAERGRPYGSMYSRALLPGSHFLAALIKLRHPETRWLAEFSDPVVLNPYGERRRSVVEEDATWELLWDAVREAGLTVPEERTVHELCELVAYALADEVLLTNAHQLDFMAADRPPRDAALLRSRAVVSHHPAPSPDLYQVASPDYELPSDRVNVAYFGAFFATRGLTEVVDALSALAPDVRTRLAFHVFTSDPGGLVEQVAQRGLDDVVRVNGFVDYFECLALVARMDVVLLNDARTRQHYDINPYLPSKWADYSASGTDVWALVEEGSVLDGMQVAHKTSLGDAAGVRRVFERLVGDRATRSASTGGLPG